MVRKGVSPRLQLYKMAANVGSCKTCLENNNKESLESENNDEKLSKFELSFKFFNIRVEILNQW